MSDNKNNKDETNSGKVVNGHSSCKDFSDTVPFYTQRGIYLKPIAKINVSVNLPQLKTPGKTISTWDVMEKMRLLIRPDEFASLKVIQSTLEFMRFEADLGDKSRLQRVLAKLDGQRLNLAGFPNILKVKAAETKDDFPSKHSWDSYFRDARHMNELKAGERPDTIHITGLPISWFCEDGSKTPSEQLMIKIFHKWGDVKRVDIPAADPYRSRMRLETNKQQTFSFGDGIYFDIYIQFSEYMDFVKTMNVLRGMKLLKKEKESQHQIASIKVDFDKTKHMTDNSVSRRAFERKRLIAQDDLARDKLLKKKLAEEKEKEEVKNKQEKVEQEKYSRRRMREEKRKRKAITVFRKQEEDKVSLKIAYEERKLIKTQRQLESMRLLGELFDRIKKKKSDIDSDKSDDEKSKAKNKDELGKKFYCSLLQNNLSATLKNGNSLELYSFIVAPIVRPEVYLPGDHNSWYYNSPLPLLPYPPMNNFRRGRGMRGFRGNRGPRSRRDASDYQPPTQLNEQYYKYFASLVGQDYHDFIHSDEERYVSRRSRSRNRSRSRSRSRSKSRDRKRRSLSKSRRRSRSRSRTRSPRTKYNRRKHRTRSPSRTPPRSKRRHRSNSRFRRSESQVCVTRAKSRTPVKRNRSRSWSLPRSTERRSCSWAKDSNDEKKVSDEKNAAKNDSKKTDGNKETKNHDNKSEHKEKERDKSTDKDKVKNKSSKVTKEKEKEKEKSKDKKKNKTSEKVKDKVKEVDKNHAKKDDKIFEMVNDKMRENA
ncbi:unnamed protein product [Trichogramma brassicae]|uniref:RRM domain-containing protein n=1 Tax=Trichogramma brassicae TaxID=86971 RepID=A0A6H5IGP6_9HYME|nr:unnamed protein product [Trichogramma brassicae]